ncbi:cytochrome c nitrite reductase pentaheme subunit [Roseimaritima multifibrata]|uniref:Cytochrome c nitrite reductase pentaheme subunit n=1 Tax=Roseimaritima multifibrata TaxID=1930274 RepID=A0A517MEZ0_9BACT|nr:tetratricopeptide repeat protein [Roseimaritima multifibrata]QDS93448.1 cytochrome c nitrite reductase pentaheme subunit [Roseimaritima multifibrata]
MPKPSQRSSPAPDPSTNRGLSRRTLLATGLVLTLSLLGAAVLADYFTGLPLDAEPRFVGRQSCIECHQTEVEAFNGSHHDRAMDLATEETVRGDFDDATIETHGIVSRMFKRDGRFFVNTEGPDGELNDFEVKYVFGYEPLQQYMVEFDRTAEVKENEVARLQVLRISWDTEKKRWFYLSPPDVSEKLEPDDPLHWTGIAQRWQTMCAECHSTDLVIGFDDQDLVYHTTFSEIDVSCEACHGPASLHVEMAKSKSLFWDRHHGYGLAKLKTESNTAQVETCAPCHSRRGVLSDDYQAGDAFCDHFNLEILRDPTYFADGQVRDEDYVYGSFIQSKMYHKNIRCTDCHDPHSLKLKFTGNQTCTSCHQHPAGKYDTPAHHHHAPGTPGASCVNCHMPERTYMEVDPRRDHSIRIPRPDLSVKHGLPNACSGCHVEDQLDQLPPAARESLNEYADWQEQALAGDAQLADLILKTDEWCDAACEKWYGKERHREPHFAEPLLNFRERKPGSAEALLEIALQTDLQTAAIARATALDELLTAGPPSPQAVKAARELLAQTTPAQEPIVRAAAIRVVGSAPIDPRAIRKTLLPELSANTRLERQDAARALVQPAIYSILTSNERHRVDLILLDIKKSLMATNDRAGAHMAWAGICEQRGDFQEAISAYETAISVEPKRTGARTQLASLLEQMTEAERERLQPDVLQRRQDRIQQLRKEELPFLKRDADLVPDNAFLQYRLGLAYYLAGEYPQALEQLQRAIDLEPQNQDYQLALRLLKEKLAEQP